MTVGVNRRWLIVILSNLTITQSQCHRYPKSSAMNPQTLQVVNEHHLQCTVMYFTRPDIGWTPVWVLKPTSIQYGRWSNRSRKARGTKCVLNALETLYSTYRRVCRQKYSGSSSVGMLYLMVTLEGCGTNLTTSSSFVTIGSRSPARLQSFGISGATLRINGRNDVNIPEPLPSTSCLTGIARMMWIFASMDRYETHSEIVSHPIPYGLSIFRAEERVPFVPSCPY